MEFNKAYNRQEFVHFLQHRFLPDDFVPTVEPVTFYTKMTYTTQAVKLGTSAVLDLVVYEVKHTSKNAARVSLSKEAFRMLADETVDRALEYCDRLTYDGRWENNLYNFVRMVFRS